MSADATQGTYARSRSALGRPCERRADGRNNPARYEACGCSKPPISARESRASAVSRLTDPIDPRFVLDFQQSTLARPIASAFLDTMVQESLKVPARVWRAALAALLESNFSSEIHAIRAPTLIVWGEQDTIASRSDQEVLAN